MLKNIDHIGIAVKDLDQSRDLFERLTGHMAEHTETVESEGVHASFIRIGATKLELLQPMNEGSPIQKFIDKRGEGIQQMAFEVEDIRAEMNRLREEGFILLNDEPKKGANNTLVCFVHPKSANGILVELRQKL